MAVPKGHPGSWFAEWQGESLPCIHKHALRKGRYVDEGVTDHPAWPRFIAELREKQRAILTTSHPPGDDGIRRRKSYVGICEIGDVEVANGIMAFAVKSLLHRF